MLRERGPLLPVPAAGILGVLLAFTVVPVVVAVVLAAAPAVAPTAPAASRTVVAAVARSVAASGWSSVGVPVAARKLAARAGFRPSSSGPVLDVARFTSVAALALPSANASRHAVLDVSLQVDVPIRIALSVRAWCEASRSPGAAPDGRTLRDVLVIGQNPVPGGTREQVASRTLTGRAVVDLPVSSSDRPVPVRCVLQVSPRTESVRGSWLRVLSGTFRATSQDVVVRGAQRPAVLVGRPGAPGLPASAGPATAIRAVAVTGPTDAPGGVRAEGEAELTTCALGYHLCERGTADPSVVNVVLVLADLRDDGRVCRTWRGSTRRVTVTPAVHHVKVAAPALVVGSRCGSAVRAHLEVRHLAGNAVEVEPTLGVQGGAVLVQTLVWVVAA